jgi:hypothetical protein
MLAVLPAVRNSSSVLAESQKAPAAIGYFIVMELIKGRTLRALAPEYPPFESVVQWCGHVAGALAAAHAAGIRL